MKYFVVGLISFSVFFQSSYYGSTLAPVTMAGAIIKAKSVDSFKKYKRKDCPVCKGKGWYISGDKISKVDCGYCEPEEGKSNQNNNQCETRVIKK
jgi:hypothetical protein